jgi:branched-chain amino acid transport system permease protein/neutral amino acid transport system permease protein
MHLLIEAIGFGIASGAVISLGAVGFTVQFGISNLLNLCYGSLLTLAAYLGYALLQLHLNVWLALAGVSVITAMASAALNRLLFANLLRRGTGFIGMVIVTVSAGIVLQYVIVMIAGPAARSYGQQSGSTLRLGWIVLTTSQIVIIGIAAASMLGLHLLLTRTRFGRAMRATSVNRDLARACGIGTERIIDAAWLLTGAMCGAAGVALAITTVSFDFTIGPTFLIYMIAAAVLGGIGQPYGAMLGGLVVGVASQVAAAYWNPAYSNVVAFGLLIAILLARPRGLFPSAAPATRRLAGDTA